MTSSSTSASSITYVKAACHCGLNEFRAGFPTSALPISNDLCHCSSCRHSSGQMAAYHVNVVSLLCADSDEPFHVDGRDGSGTPGGDGDLIAYHTSENAIRYFCSICSAQLIFRYLGEPEEGEEGEREGEYMCVAAGSLERTEGIVQVGYHIWVEATLDGGLSNHLRTVGGVGLPRYSRGPGSDQLPLGWRAESLTTNKSLDTLSLDDNESLRFSCHCRSLQFKITRPNPQSFLPHAPYPDLLHPSDITRLAKVRNSGDIKWWLRPLDSFEPHKYLAGHCACTFCRMTSGFEIQSWVYVPLSNILGLDDQPIVLKEDRRHDDISDVQQAIDRLGVRDYPAREPSPSGQARMKGLNQYISSPGRYRESCEKCGATAFAWQAGLLGPGPDLVCVSVGLVDEAQAGARAESWFDWCLTRVGFMEQVVSTPTVEGLAAGLKEVKRELDGISDYSDSPRPLTPMLKSPGIGKGGVPGVVTLVEVVPA